MIVNIFSSKRRNIQMLVCYFYDIFSFTPDDIFILLHQPHRCRLPSSAARTQQQSASSSSSDLTSATTASTHSSRLSLSLILTEGREVGTTGPVGDGPPTAASTLRLLLVLTMATAATVTASSASASASDRAGGAGASRDRGSGRSGERVLGQQRCGDHLITAAVQLSVQL
jgi:hypothetical protein